MAGVRQYYVQNEHGKFVRIGRVTREGPDGESVEVPRDDWDFALEKAIAPEREAEFVNRAAPRDDVWKGFIASALVGFFFGALLF